MQKDILSTTNFSDLKLFKRGKVRDVYDLGDKLLIVSTDRISCFDVVLSDGIPDKGKVLTGLSVFWFDFLRGILPNHLITASVDEFPQELKQYQAELSGRSMLVKKAQVLPVECIVRGYLSGSGWKEYRQKGSVCGVNLPAGLTESAKLERPIFTPSTKADIGHDLNVQQQYVEKLIGKKNTEAIKDYSIKVYEKAVRYAYKQGIIIADTKFEFGIDQDRVILVDEVLTPDSSRFWPADQYVPGKPQESFDKQFVRDFLEGLSWNKTPPAPKLPAEIIAKTGAKYLEAYQRLTGKELIR